MTPSAQRERILNALAGSSSRNPVYLKKIQATTKIKLPELTSLLDSMYLSRELQYCSGIKDGEAYTAYWLSGAAIATHKPATEPSQKKT